MSGAHGEQFTIRAEPDGEHFTIRCACGGQLELHFASSVRLATFLAQHGQPPLPHPEAYRPLIAPVPREGVNR